MIVDAIRCEPEHGAEGETAQRGNGVPAGKIMENANTAEKHTSVRGLYAR